MKRFIKPFTLFFLGFSLIVAMCVIALYIATPILGERKADIERLAAQAFHHQVKIESSKGIWLQTEPGLLLKNVVILDEKTAQPLLKIAELQVGFKIFSSLWQKKPVMGYLYINGAYLKIQQSAFNKISVLGLSEMIPQGTSESNNFHEFVNWITQDQDIKLDHIVGDWQKPDGTQINIPYFALTLHNNWHEHIGNLKIRQTNLGALLKEYHLAGWQISSGKINTLNLHWALNQQSVKYIKGSLNVNDVTIVQPNGSFQLSQKENNALSVSWQLKSLLGHFLWRGQLSGQWFLKLQHVQFNLDGQKWVEKNLQLNALPIKKGGFLYTIRASNLHLENLWPVLSKAGGLSVKYQDIITHLNPQGDLKNIYLEYPYLPAQNKEISPNNEPLLNWKFAAEIYDLKFSSWQKIPKISNLSGYLQMSNSMGQLHVDSEKLTIDFSNLFRAPLFFEQVQANIDWQIIPAGYKINAVNMELDNSDFKFKGDMNLWLPQNPQSPFINLFGEFSLNSNAKIPAYLPVSMIKPQLIKWFDQALPAMEGGSGTLILRGPIEKFPFPNKEGTFAVHTQLRNVNFRYLPDWPALTHLFAKLNFDGPKISIFINSGNIFASRIKSAYAEIPVILKGMDAVLHFKSDIVSDLRDASHFILQSPLNKKFGKTLSLLRIDGESEIKLNLDINLENDNVPTLVRGNIDMSEATVILPVKQLAFENISGILHFTQDGIQNSNLHAEFLNEPVALAIKRDQNAQTLFQFSGKARLPDIQKALKLPHFSQIQGDFSYQTKLAFSNTPGKEGNYLLITSNLKGIKSRLPSPFNKLPNDVALSKVLINFAETQPAIIHFNYGDKLNGILQYRSENFDFDRGNISIGKNSATLPAQEGLWITGLLPDFNWEEWKKFLQLSDRKNAAPTAWPKILKQISLQFKNIELFQQKFQDIKFNLSRVEKSWLLGLVSPNIVGQLKIPDEKNATWEAHFEKIYLQRNPESSKSTLNPLDVPRLSCFAHDFRYGNKQLGQVQFVLEPLENGLKIQRLTAQSPSFSFFAQGRWQAFSNRQYTNLTGQITSSDIGNTLLRLEMPASIASKNGKLLFNLEWLSSPYDPIMRSLSGRIDLSLNNGRIVDIGESASQKIGMGQLLNFFSLQNLPRHLTLDFSDVSKRGFPFDIMRGHFVLKDGNAYTSDTYWEGPVAHVSMQGNISLANQNYDLYLRVTPHITSSLPIVAAIAGGPVVGLSTWVADKLLSKQFGKLMTYSYHMSGPWSNASLTPA